MVNSLNISGMLGKIIYQTKMLAEFSDLELSKYENSKLLNLKLILTFLSALFLALISFSHQSYAENSQSSSSQKALEINSASPKQLAFTGFADEVESLLPAVVNISVTQDNNSRNSSNKIFEDFRGRYKPNQGKTDSDGSGFIISEDGFIVTNNHLVEDAIEIIVNLSDGSKYKAKIVGIDKQTDLALLKIESEKNLSFVKFGDSTKSRIGDWVIVIGNPYGFGGSVSVGIVSAKGRDINNGQSNEFIQTDAAINKGNSGGPMFNLKGEVIGVSTAIISPSGGNVGIGLATPSSIAQMVVSQLKEKGEVTRGWLGVSVQDVTDEIAQSMQMKKVEGAFVVEVVKDGPAEKAGILPADIIVKFDDQDIKEMKILPKTVSRTPIGNKSKMVVIRRGELKTLDIEVSILKQ